MWQHRELEADTSATEYCPSNSGTPNALSHSPLIPHYRASLNSLLSIHGDRQKATNSKLVPMPIHKHSMAVCSEKLHTQTHLSPCTRLRRIEFQCQEATSHHQQPVYIGHIAACITFVTKYTAYAKARRKRPKRPPEFTKKQRILVHAYVSRKILIAGS